MSASVLALQSASAFLAIIGFGLILHVPKNLLMAGGLAGAVNWFVYCLVIGSGGGEVPAALMCSIAAAASSHILARVKRAPVMVFLLPGILPTVPGAAIYRTVYYLSMGENGLAGTYLAETIQIAGAMALGIFIVDAVSEQVPWGALSRHSLRRK